MWLLASPRVVHGTGRKDPDNAIVLGGAVYQADFAVLVQLMLQVPGVEHRIMGGVRSHQAGIVKDLPAVNKTRLHALPYKAFEETLKDINAPFLAGFG